MTETASIMTIRKLLRVHVSHRNLCISHTKSLFVKKKEVREEGSSGLMSTDDYYFLPIYQSFC